MTGGIRGAGVSGGARAVVVLGWTVQGRTGWGLLGVHLGMQLERLGVRVVAGGPVDVGTVPVGVRGRVAKWREWDGVGDAVVLQGLGNNFDGPVEAGGITGVIKKVGVLIFEDAQVDAAAVERLRQFDRLIVPSQWCLEVVRSKGLEAQVVLQGYDSSIWRPQVRYRPVPPKSDGQFFIFAGGKLEFRKGQDIVVEAFKRFLRTPEGKEAVLVTQWQNGWPQTMEGIWSQGYVQGIPVTGLQGLDIHGWCVANGIPDEAHVEIGSLSQPEAASVIRECDVAIAASRAEGATNMVLAETVALGIPSIVSQNTGHRSLPTQGMIPLTTQRPVTAACRLYQAMDGWGESDPDEIVAQWQWVRTHPMEAQEIAALGASDLFFDGSWTALADDWLVALRGLVEGL